MRTADTCRSLPTSYVFLRLYRSACFPSSHGVTRELAAHGLTCQQVTSEPDSLLATRIQFVCTNPFSSLDSGSFRTHPNLRGENLLQPPSLPNPVVSHLDGLPTISPSEWVWMAGNPRSN